MHPKHKTNRFLARNNMRSVDFRFFLDSPPFVLYLYQIPPFWERLLQSVLVTRVSHSVCSGLLFWRNLERFRLHLSILLRSTPKKADINPYYVAANSSAVS